MCIRDRSRDVMRSRFSAIGICIFAGMLAGCSTSKPGAPANAADASSDGTGGMGGGGGDAAVSGCGASTIASGTFNFTFDNVQYSYIVHLSPSYDGSKPAPLVLNWHASTRNASAEESYTNMDPVADANGWVLVYPNSPDGLWNALRQGDPSRDDIGVPQPVRAVRVNENPAVSV